jgi:hypothetical protein
MTEADKQLLQSVTSCTASFITNSLLLRSQTENACIRADIICMLGLLDLDQGRQMRSLDLPARLLPRMLGGFLEIVYCRG